MFQYLKNLINLWGLHKDSKWFEKNEPAQDRFEENEEWLEELEERVDKLEQIAHPAKDIEDFESYPELIETIKQIAREELGTKAVNSEEQ